LGPESNYAVKQIMQLSDMHLSGVHCTLINKLLLMQVYLINIRPKLHHRKWQKLHVSLLTCRLFQTFSTSLLMLFFV